MSASRRVATASVIAALVLSCVGAMSSVGGQVPQHIWSQRFGDNYPQEVWSIAADDSGNFVVTGAFYGTVDFGGGPLTAGNYDADIFVAKFDAAGNHVWSERFGDDGYQVGNSVAVDDSGNAFATGVFLGTVDFGGGTLASAGSQDIFVAKFDGAGNHVWSQRFGNENEEFGESVAVDDSGNVYLTGGISGTVDFGGGPLTSAGSWDIFVAKFDGDGNHVWSERFGGVGSDGGSSVTVDGSGNVVVTGVFQDNVDFGGGQLTCAGSGGIFVAKFHADGNHLWSQRFCDASGLGAECVAVDGSGDVIVTGSFQGTVDFGGGSLTSADSYDIYVVKFDGDGNHLWSQRFGNDSYDWGESVTVDGSGNVVVTGAISGTVDFGGGPLTSAGYYDIFVAKFDGAGNHVWSQRFGDASSQAGNWVAVDALGNVFVTGNFDGTVDFGGGPLTAMMGEPPDIFVAKFGSEPMTPTLLQSFSATVKETGIEINWCLAEAGTDMEFHVLRAEAARTHFQEIYNASVVQEDFSFTFVDNSCLPASTYRYRVDVSDEDGWKTLLETEAITTPLRELALDQNYPNPFNPTTTISFVLPEEVDVDLSIFNVEGRRIRTLVNKGLPEGFNKTVWDGRDAAGNMTSSGVYLYRLTAGKKVLTKKMVFLK